jgi:hypothetical protein
MYIITLFEQLFLVIYKIKWTQPQLRTMSGKKMNNNILKLIEIIFENFIFLQMWLWNRSKWSTEHLRSAEHSLVPQL